MDRTDRYPLRALGLVPRLRRNAKERNRGRFTQAVPVYRRRSVRAWVDASLLANADSPVAKWTALQPLAVKSLGESARLRSIKNEGYRATTNHYRLQFCGLVPA